MPAPPDVAHRGKRNRRDKRLQTMAKSEHAAYREWLVDYLAEQTRSGALTRAEAIEHIRAAADRAALTGTRTAAQAEVAVRDMIAALPTPPER